MRLEKSGRGLINPFPHFQGTKLTCHCTDCSSRGELARPQSLMNRLIHVPKSYQCDSLHVDEIFIALDHTTRLSVGGLRAEGSICQLPLIEWNFQGEGRYNTEWSLIEVCTPLKEEEAELWTVASCRGQVSSYSNHQGWLSSIWQPSPRSLPPTQG